MLLEHFKLGSQPFGVTPDTRFLFLSNTHREALASLFYGIQSGRGFTALIAPPGMGKTTLLYHLLGLLMDKARTAFLFQTLCGPEEFLRSMLTDLGIEDDGGDLVRMHAKLNAYLLQESKNGRQVVVVIDEAQNLDERVLELVRMLSNFETPGKKLLQLVLSGQPQLAERLSCQQFTQLRQRISIIARLTPFTVDETRDYIDHRLRVAGSQSREPLFSQEAYAMIAAHSDGIPRNINNLCFNAMSLACALNKPRVDSSVVRETLNDLDLTTIPKAESTRNTPKSTSALSFESSDSKVFVGWRYRWVFTIFLLATLVAFSIRWGVPSNDSVLALPAAAAVHQQDSDGVNPQKNRAQTSSLPTGDLAASGNSPSVAALPVSSRKIHSRLIRHFHSRKSERADHELPQPVVDVTSAQKGLEKPEETGEKSSVPLEPAPPKEML